MNDLLLDVSDLKTYFYTRRGVVKAVDGVSFTLKKGEILGIVGESGCGKTMTCFSIMRMVPPPNGKIVDGQILFKGDNLVEKGEKEMRKIRGRAISMVLQEPMTALNPVFSIGEQIAEPIRIHQKLNGKNVIDKVKEMLSLVGIFPPEVRMLNYPHQMSGGMRQRVAGAIGLSCQPEILIADEPTSALDVTLQAQYIELVEDLHKKLGISIIFITHDFGIVARICTKVLVMYAGKVVESASVEEIFKNPLHPYTIALIKSVPNINKKVDRLYALEGQPPSLLDPPKGCRFASRCPLADKQCIQEPIETVVGTDHSVWCWRISHE